MWPAFGLLSMQSRPPVQTRSLILEDCSTPLSTSHELTVDEPTNTVLDKAYTLVAPMIPSKIPFKQSPSTQEDIVVLHVAYILQELPNLQDLILKIVRLSEKPGTR